MRLFTYNSLFEKHRRRSFLLATESKISGGFKYQITIRFIKNRTVIVDTAMNLPKVMSYNSIWQKINGVYALYTRLE